MHVIALREIHALCHRERGAGPPGICTHSCDCESYACWRTAWHCVRLVIQHACVSVCECVRGLCGGVVEAAINNAGGAKQRGSEKAHEREIPGAQ